MYKKQIWEFIKERGFDMKHSSDFIYLIDQNLDRVEFVDDHIGLRDVAFATETGVKGYTPFFVAIDVNASNGNTYDENNVEFNKSVESRELIALNQLEKFFKETSRKICLCFGFKECETYDQQAIIEDSKQNPDKSLQEIMKDNREFPAWYERFAKSAEDVTYLPKQVESYLKDYLNPSHKKSLLSKVEETKTYVVEKNEDIHKLEELTIELENIALSEQ